MAPSTNSPHNRPCCAALRDGSGNAQLHVGSSENALTRIATTSSRSWGDATRGLRLSAAIHFTPTVTVSSGRPSSATAASVEIQGPAPETHTARRCKTSLPTTWWGTLGVSQDKAPAHRPLGRFLSTVHRPVTGTMTGRIGATHPCPQDDRLQGKVWLPR